VVDHRGDQQVVYLSEAADGSLAKVRTKFFSQRG